MSPLPCVTLFTRHDCHLCALALAQLERLQAAQPFELRIVDLDAEVAGAKRAAYDLQVPVIELDGRKIMKYHVDADRLLRLLSLRS